MTIYRHFIVTIYCISSIIFFANEICKFTHNININKNGERNNIMKIHENETKLKNEWNEKKKNKNERKQWMWY
jgi:hypothetical protein